MIKRDFDNRAINVSGDASMYVKVEGIRNGEPYFETMRVNSCDVYDGDPDNCIEDAICLYCMDRDAILAYLGLDDED